MSNCWIGCAPCLDEAAVAEAWPEEWAWRPHTSGTAQSAMSQVIRVRIDDGSVSGVGSVS